MFRDVPAEGADLKEGTDSGTLQGNTFSNTGFSGRNSADSAVDAKGNDWVITANVVDAPQGSDSYAFQTHTVPRLRHEQHVRVERSQGFLARLRLQPEPP